MSRVVTARVEKSRSVSRRSQARANRHEGTATVGPSLWPRDRLEFLPERPQLSAHVLLGVVNRLERLGPQQILTTEVVGGPGKHVEIGTENGGLVAGQVVPELSSPIRWIRRGTNGPGPGAAE